MFLSLKGICRLKIVFPIVVIIVFCFMLVDLRIAEAVHQYPQWYQSIVLKKMTVLGDWKVMLAFILILYIGCRLFKVKDSARVSLAQIGIALIGSNFIVLVSKILLGRARPMVWFDQHLYGFYGPSLNAKFWSFPSGHTVTIMAICWSLALLYSRYAIIWLTLGLLIVVTRIILLQHYLSDVLTSTYLALIVSVAVRQYQDRWKKWV